MEFPPPLSRELREQHLQVLLSSTATPAEKQSARETLITCHLRLVTRVISPWRNYEHVDRDDLFQAGVLGLIKAVDNTDGSAFGAYAERLIRLFVFEYLGEVRVGGGASVGGPRNQRRFLSDGVERPELERPVPLETDELLDDLNVLEQVEVLDQQTRLRAAVNGLPGLESNVVARRAGLTGGDPTFSGIAEAMGLPIRTVTVLETQGFARLRHPSRAAGYA